MGKNKKSKIKIFDKNQNRDIEIDSVEEWCFYNWVLELYDLGVVKEYIYQPDSFKLVDDKKYVPLYDNPKGKERSLLRSHEYTADFKVKFDQAYGELLAGYFKIDSGMVQGDEIIIWIDVKGTFQRNGGDRAFSINQKLVYDKFGIYVQKTVPRDLFSILGVPRRCLRGPGGRPSKIYISCNLVDSVFSIKNGK